jgi:hypothetical protein
MVLMNCPTGSSKATLFLTKRCQQKLLVKCLTEGAILRMKYCGNFARFNSYPYLRKFEADYSATISYIL